MLFKLLRSLIMLRTRTSLDTRCRYMNEITVKITEQRDAARALEEGKPKRKARDLTHVQQVRMCAVFGSRCSGDCFLKESL